MAGMTFKAEPPDEIIKALEDLEKNIDGITDDMLDAAADAVVPEITKNLDRSERGGYGTGEGDKTIKKSLAVKKRRNKSGKSRFITFDGESTTRSAVRGGKVYVRKAPVRINEIAAVLEYGKSRQAPRPYLRPAFIAKDEAMRKAMEDVFERETRKYQDK